MGGGAGVEAAVTNIDAAAPVAEFVCLVIFFLVPVVVLLLLV